MFGTGVQHWHDVAPVSAAKKAAIGPLRTAITEHLAAKGEEASSDVAAVTAWSVVHGLAMLLIDRSLDRPDAAVEALRWFVAQLFDD
jgi:hypothetical protein